MATLWLTILLDTARGMTSSSLHLDKLLLKIKIKIKRYFCLKMNLTFVSLKGINKIECVFIFFMSFEKLIKLHEVMTRTFANKEFRCKDIRVRMKRLKSRHCGNRTLYLAWRAAAPQ